MKKILTFVLTLVMFSGLLPAQMNRVAAASTVFKDVPSSAWYYSHVQYVSNDPHKLMVGYAGNFGPLDELTVEQFINIAVQATGWKAVLQPGEFWSTPYIKKGLELGFVLTGEFSDYKRPITRAEMARIIIRSLPSITGEKDISYDLASIKAKMVDYDSIPTSLRDSVCKAYQLGILTGGTDKKFNPNGSLTRASAASVIHNMLDPTVRAVQVASEMWSDAEFEAFMKSSDADKYVNRYLVTKIENRKIYWKSSKSTSSILIPETNNPGVNDMVYNIVKIMAYHTKKVNGYLDLIYSDKFFGGSFLVRFFTDEAAIPLRSDGDIALSIYAMPSKCSTADTYFPGQQKGDSHYEWVLGLLYTDEYLSSIGYKDGMSLLGFNCTDPKYEIMFKLMCQEVYGLNQGEAFYKFAMQETDNTYGRISTYKAEYIGVKSDIGCEIVYHYPDISMRTQIWTDRPEARK